jgi:hypothetical protein
MTMFPYKNAKMQNIPKVDDLKVSWDDNACKLIHKKCHSKSYYNDLKYLMRLYTIINVDIIIESTSWKGRLYTIFRFMPL